MSPYCLCVSVYVSVLFCVYAYASMCMLVPLSLSSFFQCAGGGKFVNRNCKQETKDQPSYREDGENKGEKTKKETNSSTIQQERKR